MNELEDRASARLTLLAAGARVDDRLHELLGDPSQGSASRRRVWLPLVAAAAAVVLLGAVAWTVSNDDHRPSIRPATEVTGVWNGFPAPPLGTRLLSVSIATADGWFVWGGERVLGSARDGATTDGAYYERSTGTWRALPPSPLTMSGTEWAAAVWTGTEVVVAAGGKTPQFAAFDPHTFRWRSIPVPSTVVAAWPTRQGQYDAPRLFWVAGRVVAITPTYINDNPTFQLFDPATNTFAAPRFYPARMVVDVQIVASDRALYFVDADYGNCNYESAVRIYDVATDRWSAVSLPHSAWRPAIVAWTGSGLLVGGGTDCASERNGVRFASVLGVGGATWHAVADVPQDDGNVMSAPTTVADGLVVSLDLGGTPFVYDPTTDRWWVGPPIVPEGTSGGTVGGVVLVALGRSVVIWSPQVLVGEPGSVSRTTRPTGTVLHLAIPDPSTWDVSSVATTAP